MQVRHRIALNDLAPEYRTLPVLCQQIVRLREVPASEEFTGREGRGMRRLKNVMSCGVDQRSLVLRMSSPEDKENTFSFFG